MADNEDTASSDEGEMIEEIEPVEEDYEEDQPPLRQIRQGVEEEKSGTDYYKIFEKYARQVSEPLEQHAEIFVLDLELITAKIRDDLDDPDADHSSLNPLTTDYDNYGSSYTRRKRNRTPRMPNVMVPVIKIYGLTKTGASVVADVYGFYPVFRLQIVSGEANNSILDRLRLYSERSVLVYKEKDESGMQDSETSSMYDNPIKPNQPRNIIKASIAQAYSAFPYRKDPSTFFEYTMSKSHSIKTMCKYYESTTEFDTPSGVIKVIPHCGDDAMLQFMVARSIKGCGWVRLDVIDPSNAKKAETEDCHCNHIFDSSDGNVKPDEENDSIPDIRIMGFDIECLKDAGLPDAKKQPVIVICAIICVAVHGIIDKSSYKYVGFTWYIPGKPRTAPIPNADTMIETDSEAEMLDAFGKFMHRWDPDILVGHNITGFDIPYLVNRANVLNVKSLLYMGRKSCFKWTPPIEVRRVRKSGSTRISYRVNTPGRIQLDTLPFMQGQVKESSYKLGYLASKYVGMGKDDVPYQMIKVLWLKSQLSRKRLVDYCFKDVLCSLELAAHRNFEMVMSIIELSRNTKVPAAKLLRSGNQEKVKTLVLHQAKNMNFNNLGLPIWFPYETPKSRDKDDKFTGATVVSPQRGVSKVPVAVGDFKSLYPSIQISKNISYDTMLDYKKGDPVPDHEPPHDTSPVGAHFVKREIRQGILPVVLQTLLARRAQANKMKAMEKDPKRKAMFNFRQLMLKIIANSVYGVLTASGGWFVRMIMGESVTAWGRTMIDRAKSIASAPPFNANVIYGDSVTGDTPIHIKYNDFACWSKMEDISILIDGCCPLWLPYHGDKEHYEPTTPLHVWSHSGWNLVFRIIRHKTTKKLYRITTNSGIVDVTEDHSLLYENMEKVTPNRVSRGERLLHGRYQNELTGMHCLMPEPRDPSIREYVDSFLNKKHVTGRISCFISDKLETAELCHYCSRCGLYCKVSPIKLERGVYFFTCSIYPLSDDPNIIKRIDFIGYTSDYVYDLETEDGVFGAGIGIINVHNTDSIMMQYPGATTVSEAKEQLVKVCKAVTATFPPPVELQAEKVYLPHIQFGKKRYAGYCYIDNDPPKIDSKGIEKNRLDNCPLVRKMLTVILDTLLINNDLNGALDYIFKTLSDLVQGRIEYSDLVITKSISKPLEEYKSVSTHIEVAKKMAQRDKSYTFAPGERIPYVIVNAPGAGGAKGAPKTYEKAEDPLWAITHNMVLDIQHYIDDISRPVARVMMWYIAPSEMLQSVKEYEAKINKSTDSVHVESLTKALMKHLDKMIAHVANKLFGPAVLAKIRKPPPSHSGPLCKFFKPTKTEQNLEENTTRLEKARIMLKEAKNKCVECRGGDDDDDGMSEGVSCVQRDCPNLFKVALATRDIEDLVVSNK